MINEISIKLKKCYEMSQKWPIQDNRTIKSLKSHETDPSLTTPSYLSDGYRIDVAGILPFQDDSASHRLISQTQAETNGTYSDHTSTAEIHVYRDLSDQLNLLVIATSNGNVKVSEV